MVLGKRKLERAMITLLQLHQLIPVVFLVPAERMNGRPLTAISVDMATVAKYLNELK